jgi:hypothetical protein
MIEFFDIGNHLELAGRLHARPQYACRPSMSKRTGRSTSPPMVPRTFIPAWKRDAQRPS